MAPILRGNTTRNLRNCIFILDEAATKNHPANRVAESPK
jgi:hypothetical protein